MYQKGASKTIVYFSSYIITGKANAAVVLPRVRRADCFHYTEAGEVRRAVVDGGKGKP